MITTTGLTSSSTVSSSMSDLDVLEAALTELTSRVDGRNLRRYARLRSRRSPSRCSPAGCTTVSRPLSSPQAARPWRYGCGRRLSHLADTAPGSLAELVSGGPSLLDFGQGEAVPVTEVGLTEIIIDDCGQAQLGRRNGGGVNSTLQWGTDHGVDRAPVARRQAAALACRIPLALSGRSRCPLKRCSGDNRVSPCLSRMVVGSVVGLSQPSVIDVIAPRSRSPRLRGLRRILEPTHPRPGFCC